jgi:hypothetical protein
MLPDFAHRYTITLEVKDGVPRTLRAAKAAWYAADPGSIFEWVPALRRNVSLRRVRDTKRRA